MLLLIWYIGFTMGLTLMDFINVKEKHYLHMYSSSPVHLFLTLLISPIIFPFYLLVFLKKVLGD